MSQFVMTTLLFEYSVVLTGNQAAVDGKSPDREDSSPSLSCCSEADYSFPHSRKNNQHDIRVSPRIAEVAVPLQ